MNLAKDLRKLLLFLKGGWNILKEINLDNIKTRDDFKNIPITRKSSLTDIQKISIALWETLLQSL